MKLQMPTAARRLVPPLSFFCAAMLFYASAPAKEIKLDGRTFTLPDGFTIEKVAGPPLVDRPIQADFDEEGHLYVADSSGSSNKVDKQLRERPHRIVRLTDSKGNGIFDQQTVFADHMMFPEGSMWHAGSVYVGAPPSIWKLTDTNGDGVADQRVEWFQGKTLTGCANDLHGPYMGPDGWIYWCKGAFAQQTYERPRKKPFVTRAAHIFRARPDGSGIEPVMTGGMDNPVHVAFMPNGERLFTTTFLVNPAGGQRDGIIHAIYGGIYGKVHDVIDDHPHTSPDVMPVLVHLGPAAACGLMRYQSDVFGPEYRDNVFASSFNLHKVTRHILKEEGATYAATNEDFLVCDSLDFHPTDLIEDADGSMLVIDTGGWYKLCCPTSQIGKPDVLGAIYRVRREGARAVEDPRGLQIDWTGTDLPALANLLGDSRPAVQKRAIETLAQRGAGALGAIANLLKSSSSVAARRNAVWAATRIDDPQARQIPRLALRDADESVRQVAAHSISVRCDRDAVPDLIELLLNSPSAFNRRVAAEALGRLQDPRAITPLLGQLSKTNDRVLDHSLTYALIEIDDAKATAAGLASPDPRVRRSAMIALDQMEGGSVDAQIVCNAMTDSDTALRETAAWIAARHPEWGPVLATALQKRTSDPNLSAPERKQLQYQLAKMAQSSAIQTFMSERLGAGSSISSAERRLILRAIAEANLKEMADDLSAGVCMSLGNSDPDVVADAITAASKLRLRPRGNIASYLNFAGSGGRPDLPARTRLAALLAVPGGISRVDDATLSFLLSRLQPDAPANEQMLAAQVIERTKLTPAQLSALTETIKSVSPLEIGAVLRAFAQTKDPSIGAKLATALTNARSVTSLRPEAIRAALTPFGDEVRSQGDPIIAKLNPDASQQKANLDELLTKISGGDVRRGQLIFNSAKAACATCHAIGYVGGHVGPDLTRVGAIRTERDLLESIVYPSASFVQSFEPVAVQTVSGTPQYGILRKNDAEEIVLVTGPNQEVRIAKKDVKEIKPGTVSLMPQGLPEQLSAQELADLIAFLKACK